MKIAIVGSGYVGLVTGACFAQVGHQVICVDNDERKVEMLRSGDVRNSVAVDLVNDLIREGAYVTAYDPKGNIKIQELKLCPGVQLADTALEAVEEAEALVLATEWPDFAAIDMEEVLRMMHTPIVFDGRNLFNPMTMRDLGFQYYSIGRPSAKLIVDELPNRLVSRRDNNESTTKKLLPLAHKA